MPSAGLQLLLQTFLGRTEVDEMRTCYLQDNHTELCFVGTVYQKAMGCGLSSEGVGDYTDVFTTCGVSGGMKMLDISRDLHSQQQFLTCETLMRMLMWMSSQGQKLMLQSNYIPGAKYKPRSHTHM